MKNKKILQIVLLVAALFIPTYLMIYNISIITTDQMTPDNTVKAIVETYDGIKTEYEKREDIDRYLKVITGAAEIETKSRDLSEETPIIFRFYRGGDEYVYRIYLSLNENDCLFLNENNDLYHIASADAATLLKTDLADYLYPYKTIPSLRFVTAESDEEILPYGEGSEWYLKKAGDYYPTSVQAKTAGNNEIYVAKGRPVRFECSIDPTYDMITIHDGETLIFEGTLDNISVFEYDKYSLLTYTITLEWEKSELYNYYGKAVYNITATYDVPSTFTLSSIDTVPGDIVVVSAYNVSPSEEVTLTADNGYSSPFYELNGEKIALVPVGVFNEAKPFSISISSNLNANPSMYSINVSAGNFGKRNFGAVDTIPANNRTTSAIETKLAEYAKVAEIEPSATKLWNGSFEAPVKGNKILDYGVTVTINMGYPLVNDGIDLSSQAGSAVHASNSGKVIYTGEAPDIGKFIVIEHGFGVRTWYGNLETIGVNAGDTVEKGKEIAKSGKTGTHTNLGERLHFAVSIMGSFVNPESILARGIPGFDYTVNAIENTPSANDLSEIGEGIDPLSDGDGELPVASED